MAIKIAESAAVSSAAILKDSVLIWDFSQVREYAVIGDNSIIGSYAYIDANVQIGANCKIQNRALIYDPAIIHDGVFIGPGVILTNDKNPRAVSTAGQIKSSSDWEKSGVEIFEGASIGAGAICIAPVTIGRWSVVGAGSVISKNVKDHALVVGNPGRQVGWVGYAGVRLKELSENIFECPKTLTKFEIVNFELHEMISQ
jgi:UDP-2-acetamido-3-amino-2,3-dideoxy-glucuronate N-acetyltransferase